MILVIVSMYFVNGAITWQLIKRSDFHREQFVEDENKTTANENRRNNSKPPRYPWKFDLYNYLFTSMLVAGFSVGLKMSAKYNENEKRRKELEKEKLSSELAFLKNQVSPHFFFNTLNNIYSLTEINTKEAQNAILKLSKLMRYLLYESERGDVKLSSEIAFITNYIQLMKLRISEKVNISVTFPDTYKDISFPPLIFIPFVENAFKHGVSYKDNSFINIDLKITESNLEFRCKNSISGKPVNLSESGIGLENARKRLLLLFPETHKLLIHQHDNIFEVNLTIQLESKI
ncbi:MAG: histidine kinase [Bacteroidetes bacterium]|nr:histidine kinase [Bacteroidota bacterium]